MNLYGDMSASEIIFVRQEFVLDDETYFYNARNKGFKVRKKGINKSLRPPHEVICRQYCCNKFFLRKIEGV